MLSGVGGQNALGTSSRHVDVTLQVDLRSARLVSPCVASLTRAALVSRCVALGRILRTVDPTGVVAVVLLTLDCSRAAIASGDVREREPVLAGDQEVARGLGRGDQRRDYTEEYRVCEHCS